MAQHAAVTVHPHIKNTISPLDLLMFSDDRLALPDDVGAQEREWMLKLSRSGD
jgi:hypothetical protein